MLILFRQSASLGLNLDLCYKETKRVSNLLYRVSMTMKNYITLTRRTFSFLLGGAVLAVILAINFVHTVSAKESGAKDSYESLKSFTDVLALVQKNYVEDVEIDTLVNGAIKGMLQTLDPHSGYLVPDLYKELKVETKGEFGGLGIEITIRNGLLTVVAPIEDSPAAKAGVLPGDQIIKIAEEFTKDLTLVEAVKKMRGPKGLPITISVHRDDKKELIPITIIRDVIKVKSVRSRLLEEGFIYVRLAQFQEGSSQEVRAAVEKFGGDPKGSNLKGMVLDLRNNPGGLLSEAVRVSDYFLKDGIVVYTDGRLESQRQKYFSHDDGYEPEFPVILLVNGGSASASEIVAGALQDDKRGLVLGQQTFGKGSVQTILPMQNDGALRLTTALYYTKSGRSIQAQGIKPDIIVSDKRYPSDSEELLEDDEQAREKDLPGAIKNPNEERIAPGSRKAMKADLESLLRDDPQLEEALRLLKTWDVFKGKLPIAETGPKIPA